MSRRKPAPLPEAPFKWNQRVRIKTREGAELGGHINLVGWMPFPGCWSFEVKTADGKTHKAPGNIASIQAIEESPAAPMIEKTGRPDPLPVCRQKNRLSLPTLRDRAGD